MREWRSASGRSVRPGETSLGDWRRENRQDLARQVKNSPLSAYPAYHIVIFQWVRTARSEFEASQCRKGTILAPKRLKRLRRVHFCTRAKRRRLPPARYRPAVGAPHPRKARHRFEIVEVHLAADILPRGVAERLKVPGADLAFGRSAASTSRRRRWLARTSASSAARSQRCATSARNAATVGMGRRPRQIVALARIALDVIELVGVGRRMDELERAAPDHHHRRDRRLRRDIRRSPRHGRRALRDGAPGCARRSRPPSAAASPPARSTSVGSRSTSETLAATRRGAKRPGPRRPAARGRAFEEAHLVPEPALAEHFAVIAGEDDDRVLGEPARSERLHQAAELVVDVGDRAEIGAAGARGSGPPSPARRPSRRHGAGAGNADRARSRGTGARASSMSSSR